MLSSPNDRARWRRRLAVAAAAGALLVVCVVAAVPLVLDTNVARRAIEREISALAGGEVRYDALELRYFPRPRAEFHGAAIRIPGAVDGRSKALEVRIALLPLLAGTVRPSAIRVVQPVLKVHVPSAGAGDPFSTYRALIGPVVDALARDARGMTVSISEGRIDVVSDGRKLVSLSEVMIDADVSADAIDASASCVADLWNKAQGRVRITPGSLAGSAKLQVTGLRANGPFGAGAGESALAARPGSVDVSLDAGTDGRSTFRAALTAATPQFALVRGTRIVELGATRIALDVAGEGNGATFTVRALHLGELVSQATGSLRVQPGGTAPSFELQVPTLDLARLRDAALTLAGDMDGIGALAALITAGTVRDLALGAGGTDFAAMMHPQALKVQAEVEAARVTVPAAGIVVSNGSGRFVLADGTLQGSELAGVIGRSSFSAGALAMQLLPAASLRSLRGTFKADLTDALAISSRLLARGNPAALAGIETLQGRASATIDYEAGRRVSPLVVELKEIRATGRFRGVPLALAVNRGDLRYSGDTVSASGIAGTAGASSVNNGAIDVVLGTEPAIRTAGGDATLVLDEIHPVIASLEHLRLVLGDIKSATGTAAVRISRLSGSIGRPASLDFDLAIQPRQVRLSGPGMPGPLTLAAGSLNVNPRELRLENLQASLLDAWVTASGTVEDYAAAHRRVSFALSNGSFSRESIDWVRKSWNVANDKVPRAPVALSAGRVEWTGGAAGSFLALGTARLAGGAQAEFDLAWQPGSLDLRRVALKDSDSDAVLRLLWSPSTAEVGFSGHLDHRTLERSLVEPSQDRGVLRGKFQMSIDLAQPRRSTADGTLEVADLDLGKYLDVPVAIERAALNATGPALRVSDGVVRLAGERLALSGTVEGREQGYAIDARVSAEAVDAARLVSTLPPGGRGKDLPGALWNLPVEGRVAVNAASLAYGEYVVRPLAAVVSLAPTRVNLEVSEARLCGIAIPFSAVLAPGNVEVRTRLTARNQALAETVSCLAGDRLAITGTYDLDSDLAARGPAESLFSAARSDFRFTARGGRVLRAAALNRTLAVDEVAARTHAASEAMMAGGLAYDEITVAGTLDAGRVRLDHGMLDSPALGLTVSGEIGLADGSVALQGLLAPLDTIHRAVRRVPVVGRVLGTSLVVVPLSISGSVKDPEVKVLPAAAIAATLINLMTSRFLMPVNLFDPSAGKPQRGPLQP